MFNLGERVEGFTNFLWTLLLAGGIKLGVSPVVSSRFLGIVFGIATCAVAVRLSLRLDDERPSPAHAIAPVGLAAMGAFACWCTGGLETQLFTFLVLLGFERTLTEIYTGRGFASGALFALAAMTRPEGLMLFALTARLPVGTQLQRRTPACGRCTTKWRLAWLSSRCSFPTSSGAGATSAGRSPTRSTSSRPVGRARC